MRNITLRLFGIFFTASSMISFGLAPSVFAAPAHDFVGAKKCSICHKSEAQGSQFPIWQDSAHAKAFEALGTDKAKAIAAERGIENPQTSGQCLKCHAASYYFTEAEVTSNIGSEEGVSCESCHGPGQDYMKMSVMKDQAKAVEAGLVIPDESTCVKCHNSESPTFEAFHYTEYWDKIKHPKL